MSQGPNTLQASKQASKQASNLSDRGGGRELRRLRTCAVDTRLSGANVTHLHPGLCCCTSACTCCYNKLLA